MAENQNLNNNDEKKDDNDEWCGQQPVKKYPGKGTQQYRYDHVDTELKNQCQAPKYLFLILQLLPLKCHVSYKL